MHNTISSFLNSDSSSYVTLQAMLIFYKKTIISVISSDLRLVDLTSHVLPVSLVNFSAFRRTFQYFYSYALLMHFPLYSDAFSSDNYGNISKCCLMQPKNLTPPIIFPVGTPHEMQTRDFTYSGAFRTLSNI